MFKNTAIMSHGPTSPTFLSNQSEKRLMEALNHRILILIEDLNALNLHTTNKEIKLGAKNSICAAQTALHWLETAQAAESWAIKPML